MSQTNRLLGYPDDARLLILNADDLGLCHAINTGIFSALKDGVVRSTTLMTPCPWALHAMHNLAAAPDLTFGVHLTVICENDDYRWGPLTPGDRVPSLLDEAGYFYHNDRRDEFLARAVLAEVELEFRAQIEQVQGAGLQPTHLDWHCLHSGGRADILDMSLGLAREYGLAARIAQRGVSERVQGLGLPTADHDLLDSFRLDTTGKTARYLQMLRELPEGLTEWAVHPGLDNAEMRAVQPDGALVRQTDFDFVVSPETRATLQREGIIVLNYAPLQALWRSHHA